VSALACVASVLQCVAQCVAECEIVAKCEISVAQVLLQFSVGSFIRRLRVGIVAVCFIVLQYAVVWRSAFLR